MVFLVFGVTVVFRVAHEFLLERKVCRDLREYFSQRRYDLVVGRVLLHQGMQVVDQVDQVAMLEVDCGHAHAELVFPLYETHR